MSASATSANTGLNVEWRTSIPIQEPPPQPPRPALQDREEGAFDQRVGEAKPVLGTVLSTGVSSIIEFHCGALNKTDIFPVFNHHARLLWETV